MNKLEHIAEFKAALQEYTLSKRALQTLSQIQLVLLVAPSSSGRNTIIRHLLKTGDYYFIVSDTTRKKRTNDGVPEKNGREYWFRSEEEVLYDIRSGEYLEAAVIHEQQVSGISIRELKKAQELDKIALTDAEIDGAQNAHSLKPDTKLLFVLPPNFDEWQRRLKHRGHMEEGEYKRRMQSAAAEFEAALINDYYTFIVNDSVEQAAEVITQVTKLDIIDEAYQQQARELANGLLISTRLLLETL